MRNKKPFLNEQEQKSLQDTISECEKRTSAEIAVVIEAESYSYPQAIFFGSLVFSVTTAVLVNLSVHFLLLWTGPGLRHLWIFPSVFVLCFFAAFYTLLNVRMLKRLFITKDVMLEEVREAAVTAFYGFGLDRTEKHNGLLIYVSIFEKQVHIIAGHGIRDVIDDTIWRSIVDGLTARIGRDEQSAGLMDATCRAAEILEPVFPPEKDNRNELKDLYFDNPQTE